MAEFSVSSSKGYLVPPSDYVNAGVHIGTKVATKEMKEFVKLQAADGLNLIDVDKLDLRLRIAAKALARQSDPSKGVIVSSKEYGAKPVEKFVGYTGFKAVVRRFPPGMFSNPRVKYHWPATMLFVADPKVDEKAIVEASLVRLPVIALCDTDNSCSDVDLIIPANNKGRKSLALIFWILAREVCRIRGTIPPNGDLPEQPSAFEYPVEEAEVEG